MFPLRDNIPTRRFPFVNLLFIALNAIVFYLELQMSRSGVLEIFLQQHGLVPARLLSWPQAHVWDIFTSMFLHGSWGHLIGNMWFLFVFGDNVEDAIGHVRYFFYYLLVGFGAAAAQVAASPHSTLPMIGASGAVAGVLGSYFVLYPRARVLTLIVIVFFVRVIEIPAFFFLGLWFLTQTMNGLGSISATAIRGETVGGVAWWAHAGGFGAGFLFIHLFRR